VSLLFVDDLIKRNTYLSKLTKPVESASLGRYTPIQNGGRKGMGGGGRAKLMKHCILFNNVLAAAAAAAAASADSVRSPV
jgi:hypothetical protein